MKRIEFGEFRANETMRRHLNECLDNNWITMGPKVKELEERFAQAFGYNFAVMTSSGTTADQAACMSLYENGAEEGDEIIVPALGFIATSNAVRASGFTPVWVDVTKETLNIKIDDIESKITSRTRAIISVNTMGKPCEMEKLVKIAKKYNLVLISDSCESHLCRRQGKLMSEYADMCTYSAFSAHCLLSGEGGFIGVRTKEQYDLLTSIRSHGRPINSLYFNHERFGLNFKPTDLHASIGLGSIVDLKETFTNRDKNLRYIRDNCSFLREVAYLSEEDDGDFNCPHGFSVTVKKPQYFSHLISALDKYNIHHKRNFGCIPTQHKAFKNSPHKLGDFPNSEYIGNNGIHIGCHPYLEQEDLDRIVSAFKEFYQCVS